MLRVFVSSTSRDLLVYREAAADVILDAGCYPVMMEHFGTDSQPTIDACRKKIASCDLLLLIVAFRRGWVPTREQGGDGYRSITAYELEYAKQNQIPVIVFMADETWPGNLWEQTDNARSWVLGFRQSIDRLAVFFDYEAAPLDAFRSKIRLELARYLSNSTRLQAGRISFETLIEQKTVAFIGRDWLIRRLDAFLKRNDQGYFVIRGLPGTGKTSFSAHLANTRNYPCHFNDSLQGVTTSRQFIRNIHARLTETFDFRFPAPTEEDCRAGNYLNDLLKKVSDTVQAHSTKAVVVVDALDETEPPGLARNVLYMPSMLPPGVFFVVTRRSLADFPLYIESPVEEVVLEHEAGNAQDVRQHLERFAQQLNVQALLQRADMTSDHFVALLQSKSENNFMYLFHVLLEIERGAYADLIPDDLPQGLKGYYERHWQKMRGQNSEQWYSILLPVICVLAVAKEPLTVREIHQYVTKGFPDFGKITSSQIRGVIRPWREFLWETQTDTESCFRIYHSSFQEFLREKDEIGEEINLREADKWIADTLWDGWTN